MKKASIAVFVLSCLAFLAQFLYYWPLLPEIVASHFDLQGRPDGWMGRSSYLGTEITTGLVCALAGPIAAWVASKVLGEVTRALGEQVRWAPEVGHKVRDLVVVQILWMSTVLLLAMTDIFWQASRLNVEHAAALDHIGWTLGILLGFGFLWPLVLLVAAVILFRHGLAAQNGSG